LGSNDFVEIYWIVLGLMGFFRAIFVPDFRLLVSATPNYLALLNRYSNSVINVPSMTSTLLWNYCKTAGNISFGSQSDLPPEQHCTLWQEYHFCIATSIFFITTSKIFLIYTSSFHVFHFFPLN